jgi:hypothetical protein
VVKRYDLFAFDTHHLVHLTKLKQSGTLDDFIAAFECLDFITEGMSDSFFSELFINSLKYEHNM